MAVALLVLGVSHQASAWTLHVSTSGSDSSSCQQASPCRTISFAVSKAVAGDTVIVHAGTYRERPRVMQSGTEAAPITIRAEGQVEMDGFEVAGHWIVIDGFQVDHGCLAAALSDSSCRYTGTGSNPRVYGFWLTGSNVTIRNNYVTGTLWGGVYSSGARNRVLSNRFIRTGHPGIHVTRFGGYNVIEGNEIADVMPYIYGPEDQWGQDQDGIRIFGVGHVIRDNYIHDIYSRRASPHRDAIQTFDKNSPDDSLVDVLIEGNTFLNTANAGMFQSGTYHLARSVVWRNNVFINGHGHMVQAWIRDFVFEDNVFYIAQNQGIVTLQPGRIERNTFLWVRGTYPFVEGVTACDNWAYPNPTLHDDPIRGEPGAKVDVRPEMPNIPLAVFRTVKDGTSSSLYLKPADAAGLVAGAIIEIDVDGFARAIVAVDKATGKVDFTPAISGAMSRVPGSTLPADFGNWQVAAAGRPVAVWPTRNVRPEFWRGPSPPSGLRLVR